MTTVQSMIPYFSRFSQGLDSMALVQLALTLWISILILGGTLRLLFGAGSPVVKSVSACVHILLINLIVIILFALFPFARIFLPHLPFLYINTEGFSIVNFSLSAASSFFPDLLRLFTLGFLVNLTEEIFPMGQRFTTWCFFRLLTTCTALAGYIGILALSDRLMPQIFDQWSGVILIAIWLLIGILGLSKWLLTLIAAVFNPLLGLLFAFFFTNTVGKQFTKAIATCFLTLAVFYGMIQSGFYAFSFSQFSGAVYIPSCLVIMLVLYLFRSFI